MGKTIDDDDRASSEQTFGVGICGVFFDSIAFLLCLYLCFRTYDAAPGVTFNYLFYTMLTSLISVILDLPRWGAMIDTRSYEDQSTYAVHILGNFFFFVSFCIVCSMFSYVKRPKRAALRLVDCTFENMREYIATTDAFLLLVNFLLFVLTIASVSACVEADSLMDFFDSDAYKVSNSLQIVLIVFIGFTFFTSVLQLNWKLKSFVRSDATLTDMQVFARKMLLVILCCLASFVLRIIMIGIKIRRHEVGHSPGDLVTYSVGWFVLSDFIPRGLVLGSFASLVGKQTAPLSSVGESGGGDNEKIDDDMTFERSSSMA